MSIGYFKRCKDLFKMLRQPAETRHMRLLANTIYLDGVIKSEHVQLRIIINELDDVDSIETRMQDEIDAEYRRIEREDSSWEHPSETQGRAFDNLTT